jgi:hypothetical protein
MSDSSMSGTVIAIITALIVQALVHIWEASGLDVVLAAARAWIRLCTAGLPKPIRDRRREEFDARLREMRKRDEARGHRPRSIAVRVAGRWLLGLPGDVRWRAKHGLFSGRGTPEEEAARQRPRDVRPAQREGPQGPRGRPGDVVAPEPDAPQGVVAEVHRPQGQPPTEQRPQRVGQAVAEPE